MQVVIEAGNLLVYDASKFVILVPFDLQTSQHRSIKMMHSAQFCASGPKVISYDPEKPVKRRQESATELAMATDIKMSSFARRLSSGSAITLSRPLDVRSLSYATCIREECNKSSNFKRARRKGPISYNGMPQIHPKTALPFDDHHPHLIHPFLDRPLSPPKTAS